MPPAITAFLKWCGLCVMMVTLCTAAAPAYAEANFSCAGGGASGNLFEVGTSNCSLTSHSVATGFICKYKKVLNEVFGNMYCSIQSKLVDPFGKLLILYVTFFGLLFTAGITPFTARDSMVHLIKLAVAYAFATKADLFIGVVYNFFLNLAEESVGMVMTALPGANSSSAFAEMDQQIAGSKLMTEGNKSGLGSLTLLLMVFVPPLFMAIAQSVGEFFMAFARAVLGYIMAITGLAFLLCFAPIFIGFALFRITAAFFDRWVTYLASFAIQVMIVFAFLVIIQLVPYDEFITAAKSLITYYGPVLEFGPMEVPLPDAFPTICTHPQLDIHTLPSCFTDDAALGKYCETLDQLKTRDDGTKVCPIPYSALSEDSVFIKWVLSQIIALTILVKVMGHFLEQVPDVARQLAGVKYAGVLGGQSAGSNVEAGRINFSVTDALSAAGSGFTEKFATTEGGFFDRLSAGFQGGGRGFVEGFDREGQHYVGVRGIIEDNLVNRIANLSPFEREEAERQQNAAAGHTEDSIQFIPRKPGAS